MKIEYDLTQEPPPFPLDELIDHLRFTHPDFVRVTHAKTFDFDSEIEPVQIIIFERAIDQTPEGTPQLIETRMAILQGRHRLSEQVLA